MADSLKPVFSPHHYDLLLLSPKISEGPLGKLKHLVNTLGFITGKVSAMVFIQRLNFVTLQVQEMEKDEVLSDDLELMDILSPYRHKHELNVWKGFVPKVRAGVFFEVNVASMYSLLETVAQQSLSFKNAKALTKSVTSSAIRKSSRATVEGWTSTQLCGKVFRTAFRGQLLYWSALFIVSVSFDAISMMNLKLNPVLSSLFTPRTKIDGTFLRRTWINFIRCAGGCVLTGVGASLGTLIRPGMGTMVGMILMPSFLVAIR